MRLLGILGGLSPESTVEYYRLLNRAAEERVGPRHSHPVLIHSVDFGAIHELQHAGRWAEAGELLAHAARGLEAAGAEAVLLATNTMHYVAPAIEAAITVPFLHIVDPTGAALRAAGVRRAGLLGTAFTMELPFWRERLEQRFGVEVLVPGADDRAMVHRVIFDELARGRCEPRSRADYVAAIERLRDAGAEAVILGCTEIGLLIAPTDSPLPTFDTAALHVAAAVEFSMAGGALPSPQATAGVV